MGKRKFMNEYINRLAAGLAQFWPAEATLPDQTAVEDAIYYEVAIRRLSFLQRAKLAHRLRQLALSDANFFILDISKQDRIKHINGVIARFPLLVVAEPSARTCDAKLTQLDVLMEPHLKSL